MGRGPAGRFARCFATALVAGAMVVVGGGGAFAQTAPPPGGGGGGGGGSFHLPSSTDTDKTVDFSVSGAEVRQVAGAPEGNYEGVVTGDQVTISGSGSFTMGPNLVTYLSMSATLSTDDGERAEYHWPPKGGSETVHGPLQWNQSFSLTVKVRRGVTRTVSFSVEVRNCGDWVCGSVGGSGTLTGWNPLCPDAATFFGDQAAKYAGGGLRTGYDQLLAQLKAALDQWEKESGAKASLSKGGSPIEAGRWLFSNAAIASADYVKQFSFGPDPFSKAGKKLLTATEDSQSDASRKSLWDGSFQPYQGSEADLAQAIALTSREQGRKLGPGDVFRLALDRTGGDARKAALLAHNALKSLARSGTTWLTGLAHNPGFFSKYLTTLRDGDNAGVWYHLFGTVYYQLEVTQSVSLRSRVVSLLGAGGASALYLPTWLATGATDYFLGWKKPLRFRQMLEGAISGALTLDRTGWSTFANSAEQAYREIYDRRDPDPEKYCFNVWGIALAEALRARIVPDPPPFQLVDSTRTNPFSNLAGDTRTLDPSATGSRPDLGPFDPTQPLPRLFLTNAPVDVVLEADGVRLALDQEGGVMAATGEFPYPVFPYETPDGDWGLWWVVPPGAQVATVTAHAVADGTFHLGAVDPGGGSIQTWVTPVDDGDQVSWTPAPAATDASETGDAGTDASTSTTTAGDTAREPVALGSMTREGEEVAATVRAVEFDDAGHLLVPARRDPVLALLGALLVLGGGSAAFLLLRRRRSPGAVPLPSPPPPVA